jgi:hypothetical protein
MLLHDYTTALDKYHQLRQNTFDLPDFHEPAETYSGTHYRYRFAPLPDRQCPPFPPCRERIVDGPVEARNGFLRGCTRCVHLG